MSRWNCEACTVKPACMARVLRHQTFARAECEHAERHMRKTAAWAAVADFIAEHARFSRLDMRAAGLTEQQIVYHLRRCEDLGIVRRVSERHGLHPAVYEVLHAEY